MGKALSLLFSIIFFPCFVLGAKLLPPDKLLNSDCLPKSSSCIDYNNSSISNCKDDVCGAFNILSNSIKMVDPGNAETEGAFIRCNDANNLDACRKKGSFSIVDYYSATPHPNKIAHHKGSGKSYTNANNVPYYCPMILCDVRSDTVRFVEQTFQSQTSFELGKGESKANRRGIYTYRAEQVGENMCLFASGDFGVLNLGCKKYPSLYVDPAAKVEDESCFKNTSCASDTYSHSKTFWSVSSKVVECVRDVIYLVFMDDSNCNNKNFFPGLQDKLRNTVMILLVLYIILFGVKLVTSNRLISKQEFFMLFIKIALVIYFSVGMKADDGSYKSGLTEVIYPAGLSAMSSFGNFVMNASGSNGLCKYNANDYEAGYEYLALWDSLDCRVAYYLGLYMVKDANISSSGFASTIYGIIGLIIPAFLSLEFIFMILLILYGMFVLAVAIYFVHFYVIAMVAFALTVYLGVIIVPMALFSYTKRFFDAWVKALLSYVIQPVIVMAFMAFMLLVFDSVVFGNCNFTQGNLFKNYNTWTIDGSECSDRNDPRCSTTTPCKESLGWIFLGAMDQKFLDTKSAIFFDYTIIKSQFIDIPHLTMVLIRVWLFIYLLSLFADNLGSFAAQLTSGPNIGKLATTPGELFRKMMSAITQKGASKKGPPKGGKKKGVSVSGKKRGGISVAGKK